MVPLCVYDKILDFFYRTARARNQIKNNAYGCSFRIENYPILLARLCQEFHNFRTLYIEWKGRFWVLAVI